MWVLVWLYEVDQISDAIEFVIDFPKKSQHKINPAFYF